MVQLRDDVVWKRLCVEGNEQDWLVETQKAILQIRALICDTTKKKKKKNFTSFGQPTRLIACANHGNTVICS